MRGMAHAQAQDVLPVVVARVPEDALDPGVVRLLAVVAARRAVRIPVHPESGERPSGLADVALAVPVAEREELHQLACVVLVRRLLVRVGQREEEEHGRVARHRLQQGRKAAERMAAQLFVLSQHQRRVLVRGGEVVVPEERELLLERMPGADHPVEPPEHVVAPLVLRAQMVTVQARRAHARGGGGAAVQQPADRARLAPSRPVVGLARGGAEACAPEEALHVRLGPAAPRAVAASGATACVGGYGLSGHSCPGLGLGAAGRRRKPAARGRAGC